MDFRRKAIELYKEGKTEKEISQIIGIEIKGETVSRWMMEDDLKRRKSEIAKLDRKVKDSALDYTKKQGYLVRLKELLDEILKIIPNDVEMRIKLMYTCIGLKMIEEAEKIGYSLNEETDSSNIRILNGLTIVEEKKENYDKAIEFTKKIIEIQSNNEFYKNKLKKLEKRKQEKGEKNEKELIYEEIKKLEKNMKKETEKRLGRKVIKGEKYNESEIANEVRVETYMEIQRLAMELLKTYPY